MLLILYALAVLSFSTLHGAWGMDEPPHPTHKKYMKLNKFMPWHHQKKNEELDEITVNSFAKYPEEIKLSILQYAAMNSLDEGKVDKLWFCRICEQRLQI